MHWHLIGEDEASEETEDFYRRQGNHQLADKIKKKRLAKKGKQKHEDVVGDKRKRPDDSSDSGDDESHQSDEKLQPKP